MALQFCDLATTVCFLNRGVAEGNPLVAVLIRLSSHPVVLLALLKIAACVLAWAAWRRNRFRLLRRINLLFLLCVGWNLLAITRA
jgi:hypothetical protein